MKDNMTYIKVKNKNIEKVSEESLGDYRCL